LNSHIAITVMKYRNPGAPMAPKAKKDRAIKNANIILELLRDDVVKILMQRGKQRSEILDDLKAAITIRVSSYMRLV
jgi:hypothetical protein